MKTLFLIALLAVIVCTSVNCENDNEDFVAEILKPRGFRVSIEHVRGTQEITFNGNLNDDIERDVTGLFTGTFALSDDRWVYENLDAHLSPGDNVYYRVVMTINGEKFRFWRQFHVPRDDQSV
ncbi:gram-negative bacteria-binding protein 3-like [Athalia rosae]|uniref:gram-negative bacteria-binding protein 3-like n=1 Tax=Athalia rosae TaxID=37344 RepID=UPI000626CB7A|nr:gram-negative bacteria-binding protein 3-like [Athalia rosae]